MGAIAVEIWTMDEGYYFDNILIGNDASVAEAKRAALWAPKKEAEVRPIPQPTPLDIYELSNDASDSMANDWLHILGSGGV